MNTIVIILFGVLFASLGQILLKFGMISNEPISTLNIGYILNIFYNYYVIIGLISYAMSAIFWMIALSREDLSFVYPFISLTFVFILLSSIFIFHEKIGPSRVLGTIVIIIGLIILVRG